MATRWLLCLLSAPRLATASAEHIDHEDWNGDQFLAYANGTGQQEACVQACSILHKTFDTELVNTTAYDASKAAYWSAFQAEVFPACFVQPESAEDVAEILKVIQQSHCPFAVKSGGHAREAGFSSSPGGITIDLKKLKQLQLSEDRTYTRVGPGNLWIDVYKYLTPMNLSITGGRVSGVGTGGLTLGGGISFFSGRHGWACDGVQNYELVTADSKILDVNQTSYPDLFFALRGGGNNFGIVTRFDFTTFPQGPFWGGALSVSYTPGNKTAAINALYNWAQRAPEDVDSAAFSAYVYFQNIKTFIIFNQLTHASSTTAPAIFSNFTSLPDQLSNAVGPTNMTAQAYALGVHTPTGLRNTYWTHTFQLNSPEIMEELVSIYTEEIKGIMDIKDIVINLSLAPIAANVRQQMGKNGGNALGLSDDPTKPLSIALVTIQWPGNDEDRDEEVLRAAQNTINKAVARSKEIGAYHPYIYSNYAAKGQQVFESYGEKNLEKLRSISEEWDPQGVFQELQPGGFKLW